MEGNTEKTDTERSYRESDTDSYTDTGNFPDTHTDTSYSTDR